MSVRQSPASGVQVIFETTVNLGNLLTILSFLVGGIYFVMNVRSQNLVLENKFTVVEAQIEDSKIELKKVNDILVRMATSDARLEHVEQRQLAQGKRLDETIARLNLWLDKKV